MLLFIKDMKESKLFKFYLLLILIVPATFLFLHGENTIKNEAVKGYSVLNFTNSREVISRDDTSALNFELNNFEEKELEYEISLFINKELIYKKKYSLKPNTQLTIEPGQKLKINKQDDPKAEYLIKVTSNKNLKTLKKQIKFTQ